MSVLGFCVSFMHWKLLYGAEVLGNSQACCGNWRSWRRKHNLQWWKMRTGRRGRGPGCREQWPRCHKRITAGVTWSYDEIRPKTVSPTVSPISQFRFESCWLLPRSKQVSKYSQMFGSFTMNYTEVESKVKGSTNHHVLNPEPNCITSRCVGSCTNGRFSFFLDDLAICLRVHPPPEDWPNMLTFTLLWGFIFLESGDPLTGAPKSVCYSH